MASLNGAIGTREPGPSWQGQQESVEKLHACGQSAGAEEQLRAARALRLSQSPPLPGVYTCAALVSVICLAIAESESLFSPH